MDGLGNIMQGKYTKGSGKESPVRVPKVGAKREGKVTAEERKELLSRDKVNIHKQSIDKSEINDIISLRGEPFHVFHNHGSGETFSLTDIQSFVDINNALSITAVGNNGNNYCLSRLTDNKPNAYGFFLRNKSRTTIYSVNDVNISLAKLSDSIEREKLKPVIEKLSDEQKADLARAIISQIYKCLKGGAKYGFKYTEPS
ncbi:MAG: hypothetical protein K5979_01885 [Ruminococcus sp.]|nr:hypothetical protein [Ruminococcus sp.]